jgi:hypothetical protein
MDDSVPWLSLRFHQSPQNYMANNLIPAGKIYDSNSFERIWQNSATCDDHCQPHQPGQKMHVRALKVGMPPPLLEYLHATSCKQIVSTFITPTALVPPLFECTVLCRRRVL